MRRSAVVSVVVHLLFCGSIFSLGDAACANGGVISQDQLSVNVWGSPSPVLQFKRTDPQCSYDGQPASRFTVAHVSAGGADVVVKPPLRQGRFYRLRTWMKSEGRIDVLLQFRRGSSPYTASISRTVSLSGKWQQVELKGYYLSPSEGHARIGIAGSGRGSFCIASLELAEIPAIGDVDGESEQLISADYFGVHLNKLGQHNQWPLFDPGLLRLWDTGTTWALLQDKDQSIRWGDVHGRRFDYYVRHKRAHSQKGVLMYTLGMTPSWAARASSGGCGSAPYGRDSCKPPRDLAVWEDYIRQIAVRHGRDIDVWELWNEADIPQHWIGSAKDMVDLARSAKAVLNEIDPGAKLIGPNVTTHGIRFLNEFLKLGGGEYVDGLSFHGYIGRNPIEVVRFSENLNALQRQYGLDLSLWNTEAGPSCNSIFDDCREFVDNTQDASADFYQALIYLAAKGVKTFGYYTWEGAALGKGGKALVESDFNTPTATGRAISQVRTWMVGARVRIVRDISDPDLVAIEIRQGDRRGFIVWSSRTMVNPSDYVSGRIIAYATTNSPSLTALQDNPFRVGRMPTLVVVEQ